MMGTNKGGFQWQNWDFKTGYKPIQWRSTVFAPLCAFCNKTVYPAEEATGGGQKFHKLCLKCTSCGTLLNSGNSNEHEKKIYCIQCYRRQFGPRSVGRSFGSTLSLILHTPPTSPRFNRTRASVDNHLYERKTSIGSSPSRTSSDDDLPYSYPHINKVTYIDRITLQKLNSRPSSTNLIALKTRSISGNICPRCSKLVYSAEEIKAAGKSFHKRCYSCAHCKGGINGGHYSEHDGELYDNNCYRRLFGPKGILSPRS